MTSYPLISEYIEAIKSAEDNLEELSLLIHNKNAHAYMTFFLNKDLKKYYSDELIDIIRKHVLSCSKVSDDPIYKEIMKQNGWDIE